MIYRPRKSHKMWDTWLYYHEGIHYLYHLHMLTGPGDGITLATSKDGVHFDEKGPILLKKEDAAWLGTGSIWQVDNQFIMNFSEIRDGVQAIFFAQSPDLINWEIMGDEYRCDPDPKWYDDTHTGRWDCITTLQNPNGSMWGILTARPWPRRPGLIYDSMGMVESEDGLHWHAVEPPPFDWGEWPEMNVHEPVGLEKIGDLYYVLMGLGYTANNLGERHAWERLGSHVGMYTFVAENPRGPYRPDFEAYPLLRSNNVWPNHPKDRRNSAWCARFYRTPEELLVHNHSITRSDVRWLAPLKKAIVDGDGHLKLGYWQGNESAKGVQLNIDLKKASRTMPVQKMFDGSYHPTEYISEPAAAANRLEIDEPSGGGVMMLDFHFDNERGVILEGSIEAFEPSKRWTSAGVFVEEKIEPNGASHGTAILAETRGRTEIGILTQGRIFVADDRIEIGIAAGKKAVFRFLLRSSMFEFYLDDILVQCYSVADNVTGRLGLAFESGRLVFDNLRAWEMSY